MTATVVRFITGAVVALLIAGILVSPLGPSSTVAASSDVACAPTKGQPRPSDLVVAEQTPDGVGVYVENIGCYTTTSFFQVRVTVTDGQNNFATEYVPVLQFIQPGGVVVIPVGFDCDLWLARIEVDISNSVFELNENNNIGYASTLIC